MPQAESTSVPVYHTMETSQPPAVTRSRNRRRSNLALVIVLSASIAMAAVVYFSQPSDSLQQLPDGKHYLMGMLRSEAKIIRSQRNNNQPDLAEGQDQGQGQGIISSMARTLRQGTQGNTGAGPAGLSADDESRAQLSASNSAYSQWIQQQHKNRLLARGGPRTEMLASSDNYFRPVLAAAAPAPAPSTVDPMAPSFVSPPTPANNGAITAKCSVQFNVQALGLHSHDKVTLELAAPSPAGATLTPQAGNNPAIAAFKWSPPVQSPDTTVCFRAKDSKGLIRNHCVIVKLDPSCNPAQAPAPAKAPAQSPAAPQAQAAQPQAAHAALAQPAPAPAAVGPATHQDCAPLFQYHNKDLKDHFYTTNFKELYGGKLHYQFGGVLTAVYAVQHEGMVPVFRYYNDATHSHVYTMNYAKWGKGGSILTPAGPVGHTYEGVSFYVYKSPRQGTMPVFMWRAPKGQVMFSLSNQHPGEKAEPGFKFVRLVGYAGCTPK